MLKLKAMTELTSSERGGVNTTELELESAVGPGWEGTRSAHALKHIMIHSFIVRCQSKLRAAESRQNIASAERFLSRSRTAGGESHGTGDGASERRGMNDRRDECGSPERSG